MNPGEGDTNPGVHLVHNRQAGRLPEGVLCGLVKLLVSWTRLRAKSESHRRD